MGSRPSESSAYGERYPVRATKFRGSLTMFENAAGLRKGRAMAKGKADPARVRDARRWEVFPAADELRAEGKERVACGTSWARLSATPAWRAPTSSSAPLGGVGRGARLQPGDRTRGDARNNGLGASGEGGRGALEGRPDGGGDGPGAGAPAHGGGHRDRARASERGDGHGRTPATRHRGAADGARVVRRRARTHEGPRAGPCGRASSGGGWRRRSGRSCRSGRRCT